jgi:hypothetical protein
VGAIPTNHPVNGLQTGEGIARSPGSRVRFDHLSEGGRR